MDSAKFALHMSTTSSFSSDRIKSAITHLEAAHVAFKLIHDKHKTYRGATFRQASIENAIDKDIWACCLMTICYTFLGDFTAAKKSIYFAEQGFEARKDLNSYIDSHSNLFAAASLPLIMLNLLNFKEWGAASDSYFIPKIENHEFSAFKAHIIALTETKVSP